MDVCQLYFVQLSRGLGRMRGGHGERHAPNESDDERYEMHVDFFDAVWTKPESKWVELLPQAPERRLYTSISLSASAAQKRLPSKM
jgi:hypothetical protein